MERHQIEDSFFEISKDVKGFDEVQKDIMIN